MFYLNPVKNTRLGSKYGLIIFSILIGRYLCLIFQVKVQDCAILMTSEQDSYKIQLKASLTSPAVELAAPVAQQQEQKTHSEGGCSSDNTTGDGKTSANSNLLNKTRCLGRFL